MPLLIAVLPLPAYLVTMSTPVRGGACGIVPDSHPYTGIRCRIISATAVWRVPAAIPVALVAATGKYLYAGLWYPHSRSPR